jgi:class 3 adenylate cyclase/predicted ATPase
MSDPDFPDNPAADDAATMPGRRNVVDRALDDTADGDALARADSSASGADEPSTLPRAAPAAGHAATAVGAGARAERTWTFGAGATLGAFAATGSSPGAAPASSALSALLRDIERAFVGAEESSRPGPLLGHANRFQLTSRLGRGGMGVVFKAFDHELRRFIAIKLLARSEVHFSEDKLSSFLRNEARAIAALSHPNIVQVFDISSWCDVPFLVMEYLEGRPLDELMTSAMPVARALSIVDPLLAGLEHAHAHGVIHRDLKPSNIFETTSGEIKILDFGIASLGSRAAERSDGSSPLAESISGTPGYMSPEQWQRPEQDARTDVWAVGVLLVGMLTGKPLFAERSAGEVREEVLSSRATLGERDYRIPRPLVRVIERALEKAPERRYQTVTQLRQALADAAVALHLGGRAPMAPEQRQVTIVACRIAVDAVVDFDTAADILRTWHNTVGAIVQRGGGFIMSSVGASLLACFGYPSIHEDDAVRAVGVACAIRDLSGEALHPGDRQVKVRVGVDTGFGVVEERQGVVGGVPVLHGLAVQLATHLRDRAEAAQVLLSDHTAELVRGYFALREAIPVDDDHAVRLGGRSIAAYAVSRARRMASRFEAAALRDVAPLVGRGAELEEQDVLWRGVKEGTGAVYCVVGEAGVGKSRLVHRMRQLASGEGATALTCQCWPQGSRSPFHPLIALLSQLLELDHAAAAAPAPLVDDGARASDLVSAAQRARLVTGLARLGLDSARDLALFSALLSITPEPDAPAPAESPEAQRRATIDRVAELVQRLTLRAPLLFVVEDLHWADHSTLDFLDFLLPRVAGQRLLLVLTARKEVEPFWRQRARCHERELTGLPPELAAALVQHLHQILVPGARVEERVTQEIVARSSGLPLYIEELTRVLLHRSGAVGHGDGVALPATLLGLLGTRLDQLQPRVRAVAQLGAVLGRDFRRDLLRALVAEAPLLGEAVLPGAARAAHDDPREELAALDAALEELRDKGIVREVLAEHGDAYVFRHALLQDVAYQSILPEVRRARHAQLAELLVRGGERPGAGQLGAAPPELIAYHYDQANRVPLAIRYWETAGVAAAKNWAVKEAVAHFSRALELLSTLPDDTARGETELRLLLALGPPLMSVHGYAAPRVEDTYARAYELCIRQGRHAQTFPPLVGLWQYNMVGGNLDKAAMLGTRLLTLAEAVGDSTMKLIATRAIGTTRFLQGDLAAAIEHTRAGWRLYDRAKHGDLAFKHGNDPGVAHGIYLAWALWQSGFPDQALAQGRATLELARSLGHPMSVAFSLCYTAIICNLRGEPAAAADIAREALLVAEDNQLGLWRALANIQLGWARAELGEAEGLPMMATGIAAWRQTGARAGTTFFYVALAQAQLRHGADVAVDASLATAADLVAQNGEHFFEPELLRTRARLLARSASPQQRAEVLSTALALADRQQARAWQLRLCCDLLELQRANPGLAAEAARSAAALADHRGWFVEGFDTADLQRATALLASS